MFVLDIMHSSASFLDKFTEILKDDIEFYNEPNLKEAYEEAKLMSFGSKNFI